MPPTLRAAQVTRTVVVVLTQSLFIVNSGGTVTALTVDNGGASGIEQFANPSGGGIGAAIDATPAAVWSVYASRRR